MSREQRRKSGDVVLRVTSNKHRSFNQENAVELVTIRTLRN